MDTRKELVAGIGPYLWGNGADSLLASALVSLLKSSLLKNPDNHDFSALIVQSKDLEEELEMLGMMFDQKREEDEFGRPIATCTKVLSVFVGDIDLHKARNRKQLLLSQARSLIQGDYHSSLLVGDSSNSHDQDKFMFSLPKMRISQCVEVIVNLCVCAFEEAVCTSPACQAVLFKAARDILVLFQSLVLLVHGNSLQNIPRVGALYRSDCDYIIHHLILFSHKYSYSLLDLVPVFRVSSNSFNGLVSKQLHVLDTLLVVQPSDTSTPQMIEHLGKKLVHHLAHLHKAWGDVLPEYVSGPVSQTLALHGERLLVQALSSLSIEHRKEVHDLKRVLDVLTPKLGLQQSCLLSAVAQMCTHHVSLSIVRDLDLLPLFKEDRDLLQGILMVLFKEDMGGFDVDALFQD